MKKYLILINLAIEYKAILDYCFHIVIEFQSGDFVGTPAMFVQAVIRQGPFSGKESFRKQSLISFITAMY